MSIYLSIHLYINLPDWKRINGDLILFSRRRFCKESIKFRWTKRIQVLNIESKHILNIRGIWVRKGKWGLNLTTKFCISNFIFGLVIFSWGNFSWEAIGSLPQKSHKPSHLMRSYTVKEIHIGSVVSQIIQYTHTLYYYFIIWGIKPT